MKSVRREDTLPEQTVRRFLHACGLRYALHRGDLAGTPDIVLPARSSVVFVHGCFWHGHHCGHGATRSKTRAHFWAAKIASNRERDRHKARQLRRLGWHVETIWECEIERPERLRALADRLSSR